MSWTKRQLIEGALEEIGIASSLYDIQADQLESALRRLDAMMAEWNIEGLRLGYPLGSIATSELSQDSGIPSSATEAVLTNLAIKLAPSYGKIASRETKISAKKGYGALQMKALADQPQQKAFPHSLPLGAGNKRYNNNNQVFFPTPDDPVDVGPDSLLDLN